MSWNRNDTRYDVPSDGNKESILLKKLPSVIPSNKKEDTYEALLHISRQIQFYDSKSRTDGSLQRFYGNSLPLVLASLCGTSINKSMADIRNTLTEIGARWQRGAGILRKHRTNNYKEFSYQLKYLELLKNAAIAEQTEIRDLCPTYQEIVKEYENTLNYWISHDLTSQAKKLSLQLTALSRGFIKLSNDKKNNHWFKIIEQAQKGIDELELLWESLKVECQTRLNEIIEKKQVDPLTTIPLILGELLEEFSNDQSLKVRENLARYFLENRAGLTKLETVPETIYARYNWNPSSEIETLPSGETFISEDQSGEKISLHSPENYPLNDQMILRVADVECSEKLSDTLIQTNDIKLSHKYPSKFRLDNLIQGSSSFIRSPFSFELKSTLLNIWGNVVKWEIEFHLNQKQAFDFLDITLKTQPEVRQSFKDDPIEKVLQYWITSAFEIQYQGVEEPFTFGDEQIELTVQRDNEKNTLELIWQTILDGDNPQPLANHKGEVAVSFFLREEFAFLYRFFSETTLNQIVVKSRVLELQDLEVYNDFGKVDPGTPFNMFGTKPEIGSKLYLGHPLIFCNALDNLKINWQWFGLPEQKGGFKEHYARYDMIDDNQDFLVSISALNAGTWFPEEDKQIIPLFSNSEQNTDESNENQTLSNIRRINELDIDKLELNRKQKPFETLKEPQKSKYGYMCLELVNPLGAFGHNRYNEFLQKRMADPKKNAFLSEPYTPNLGNISVEADLKEVIIKKDIPKVLNSFGIDQHILQSEPIASQSLMPKGIQRSSIYIQLDKLPNNILSLYFEIPEQLSGQRIEESKTWGILIDNHWSTISEEQIVRDETFNFESSGIIILQDLPKIPEGELIWIKIGSDIDDVLSQRKDLLTQIIRLEVGDTRNLSSNFQIESITIPENLSDGISDFSPIRSKRIVPPSLFNNPTDYLTFQYRLQNRISTYKDLRQFLLAKFPKIQEVLILAHNDGKEEIAPGNVRVVVIPKTDSEQLIKGEWPKLNSREIQTIKQFVQRSSPMGTRYFIENPQYEEIVVKGNIVIQAGMDPNEAHRIITQNILHGTLDVTGIINTGFSFGQAIYSSKILVLIKNLSFVKSVTNFACYTRFEDFLKLPKDFNSLNYVIEPSQINHILIPSLQHLLDIRVVGKPESDGIGVSNMTLETDFLVDRLNHSLKLNGIGRNKIGMSLRIEEKPKITSRKISSIKL